MDLQIVSFDVPYPPDYGGIIDVYYRIKALADAGVNIHLHCFAYGRGQAAPLEEICASVYYYDRKGPGKSISLSRPYITSSRRSKDLQKRLAAQPYPILFEGLHSCYYLDHPSLKSHWKLVRMHNIEWQYYQQLAKREPDYLKKPYLWVEAHLLKKFEKILWAADSILAISPADFTYLEDAYISAHFLPAFHPHEEVSSLPGSGAYCLYHAKLSVAENHEAAMYLIREVFSELDVPFVIAGSEPMPKLIQAINEHDHIRLVHNPGRGEMLDLMRLAHCHVLPTFQATGLKLKLLNALFCGRFIVANPPMIAGSGLEEACLIAEDAREFRDGIRQLFKLPFSEKEIDRRKEMLLPYSNRINAQKLIELLSPHGGEA